MKKIILFSLAIVTVLTTSAQKSSKKDAPTIIVVIVYPKSETQPTPSIYMPRYDQHVQKKHPEMRSDEVFITNMDKDRAFNGCYADLKEYKSVRRGKIAYDINGNKVEGYVPVFMSGTDYALYNRRHYR